MFLADTSLFFFLFKMLLLSQKESILLCIICSKTLPGNGNCDMGL